MGASLCTCSRPRSRAPHPENNDTTFIGWCTGAPLQAPFCPPAARASPLSTSDCFQVRLWPPASARSAGRCCAIGRPSRMPDQALHSRGCFPPVFTDSSSWCCRWSQEQCSPLYLIHGALITLYLIQGALVTLSQWHPATAWVPLGACSCSLPAAPGSRPHCSLTPKQPVPTGHAISTAPQTPQAACLPAAVSSQQPHPPQVALSLSTPRPPPRPRPRPTRRPPAPQTSQLRAPPSRTDFAPYSA